MALEVAQGGVSGGASPALSVALSTTPSRTSTPLTMPASTCTPKVMICVFCGASEGKNPAHMAAARQLATVMAAEGLNLCYGGGTSGIMGELARTMVSLAGPDSVHGFIPAPLVKYERGPDSASASNHQTAQDSITGLSLPEYEVYGRTTVVKDMHSRKQMMAREVISGAEGSGFIALTGGYGTLEELMEVVTWNQLGIHKRGVVVLNIDGYWDGLMQWRNEAVEKGFVGEGNRNIMIEVKSPEDAIKALKEYKVAESRFKLEWGSE